MKTNYLSVCKSLLLTYIDAELRNVEILDPDLVSFDALRDQIALFEENLPEKYFTKCA